MKKIGEIQGVEIQESPLIPDDKVVMYQPRVFQKDVLGAAMDKKTIRPISLRPPRYTYGIDFSEGKDTTVVARSKMNGKGQIVSIVFDEYGTIPKWYRNPIKWWRWHWAMRWVVRRMKKGKGWKSSIDF